MFSFVVKDDFNMVLIPSRLYIYYNTRALQGTVPSDSGASLRTTMKSLALYGACPETIWPYFRENLYTRPSDICFADGDKRQALNYASVPLNLNSMKSILQSHPFILGIAVYESFMTAQVASTGNVPIPNVRRERLLGGHAVCVIGYNDARQCLIVRNSWGIYWGDKGNFYLPYKYATNTMLSFDPWVLYTVETPASHIHIVKPGRR
jgi:C1A family cysteine protease